MSRAPLCLMLGGEIWFYQQLQQSWTTLQLFPENVTYIFHLNYRYLSAQLTSISIQNIQLWVNIDVQVRIEITSSVFSIISAIDFNTIRYRILTDALLEILSKSDLKHKISSTFTSSRVYVVLWFVVGCIILYLLSCFCIYRFIGQLKGTVIVIIFIIFNRRFNILTALLQYHHHHHCRAPSELCHKRPVCILTLICIFVLLQKLSMQNHPNNTFPS